ncbi:MAG TPA: T9SS type A sorting domain-containing protein, partial [Bacteroidia bacterium]|nr:T9SS type A sorting domain-containing protein [Bacteroidia bacterium]
ADFKNNRIRMIGGGILGINEPDETELYVYPNPASDNLYIKLGNSPVKATISMFNITGQQLMKEEKEIQGTAIIRVNNLPAGIYILKLQTTNGNTLVTKVEIAK